jgi:hypothetical protein
MKSQNSRRKQSKTVLENLYKGKQPFYLGNAAGIPPSTGNVAPVVGV